MKKIEIRFPELIKKLTEKFKTTLFLKLFLVFTVLIIFPVVVLGSFFYFNTGRSIKNEIYEINTKSLQLVKRNLESMMRNIDNDAINMVLNPKIIEITSRFSPLDSKIIRLSEVQKTLTNYVVSNDVIHSAYIFIEHENTVLTNYGYSVFDDFNGKQILIDYIDSKNLNDVTLNEIEMEGVRYRILSLVKNIPFGRSNRQGILILNIDLKKLEDILVNNIYIEGMDLIVTDLSANILLASGDHELYGDVVEFGRKQIDADGLPETNFSYHGKYVTILDSDYRSWVFIAQISDDYIEGRMAPIRNTVVVICFSLVLIGLGISFFMSGFLYKPINDLVKYVKQELLARNPQAVEYAEKDEIKYINNALRQFLSINTSNEEILHSNRQAIKNNLILNLLEGKKSNDADMEKSLDYLGINFKQACFIVLLISIDKSSVNEHYFYAEKNAIIEIAERTAKRLDISVAAADLGLSEVCMIFNGPQGELNGLVMQTAREIRSIIKKDYSFTVTLGIGSQTDSIPSLKNSLKDAEQALLFRMFAGSDNIIHYGDINMVDDNHYVFQQIKIEQIINNVKNCNKERTLEILEDIFDDISNKLNLSIQSAKYILIQLLSFTVRDLAEKNMNIKDTLGENFNPYTEMEKRETIESIKNWMRELFISIIDKIDKDRDKGSDNIIDFAVRYIEENYSSQIALTDIAEILNVTPQYLSRKFKEDTNDNFVSFLNKIRLIEAKSLLQDKEITINEVAVKVGYNNYQYFIKQFKKTFGVTPAKFRDNF